MTWTKASPVLIAAVIFDGARMFFEMFWFFGPALAAALCTAAASSVLGGGGAATAVSGLFCSAGATAIGVLGAVPIEAFGILMSMALGFAGFLTLGLGILMTNSRIFKANATGFLWFIGSFAVSEIPLIGTLPSFTIVLYRLYHTQIKVEQAALKKYQEEQVAQQLQNRRQQAAQIAQQQNIQQAQFIEQKAANEAQYAQEAANDEQYERGGSDIGNQTARQMRQDEQESSREQLSKSSVDQEADETQFNTLKDALSELNAKQNRTAEENQKLIRARQIMQQVSIETNETDPVLRAAYERARQGQKVSNDTGATKNEFVFNNVREIPGSVRRAA